MAVATFLHFCPFSSRAVLWSYFWFLVTSYLPCLKVKISARRRRGRFWERRNPREGIDPEELSGRRGWGGFWLWDVGFVSPGARGTVGSPQSWFLRAARGSPALAAFSLGSVLLGIPRVCVPAGMHVPGQHLLPAEGGERGDDAAGGTPRPHRQALPFQLSDLGKVPREGGTAAFWGTFTFKVRARVRKDPFL